MEVLDFASSHLRLAVRRSSMIVVKSSRLRLAVKHNTVQLGLNKFGRYESQFPAKGLVTACGLPLNNFRRLLACG